jgi:hypothetical protein
MSQAASNVDVLANPENVKIMSNILKTNVSACTSIGSFFLPQLGRIWLDMLGLYKAVSGIISEQVASQGKLSLSAPRSQLTFRIGRYQDTESPFTPYNQEGDFEIGRNLCQEGRRSRWCQCQPDTWSP